MIDENYVKPEQLKGWFVKEKDKPYRRLTQLEYYQKHGWLNYGCTSFEDRKSAEKELYKDWKLGTKGIKAIDLINPKVDGGHFMNISESQLHHLEKYLKAMKSIHNIYSRNIVRNFIIDNESVLLPLGQMHSIRILNLKIRQLLCDGLDDLVKHYGRYKPIKRQIVGFSKVKVI